MSEQQPRSSHQQHFTLRIGLPALALGSAVFLGACSQSSTPPPTETGQNTVYPQDQTALLQTAVQSADVDAAKAAIAGGAEVNTSLPDGTPLVVLATKNEDTELVTALISAGADVNAKDSIDDSAFLYAGAEGLNEILKLTIAHGADVSSTNRYGGTALIPAAEHGHTKTVKILLDAGVPVDHINNLGWTALHEAIVLGDGGSRQVETVRLLLAGGADQSIPDGNGTSPRELAAQQGHTDIVSVLDGNNQ